MNTPDARRTCRGVDEGTAGRGLASHPCALLTAVLLVAVLSVPMAFAGPAALRSAPNFVVIVADDLGWSDLGFLGSAINTPHLDALAQRGTFLSHFYVAPSCSPTRSMLLTGVTNHLAGVGTMAGLQTPNQVGLRGYGAQLHSGVVTIAEALKTRGYRTLMSGKWHLAVDADQRPHRRGFDRSFGLLGGGASHFADQRPIHVSESVAYLEHGRAVSLPAGFFSTISYTDKLIEYLDEDRATPFFAYLAYTAPHDPLQVPDDWLDAYAGVFDQGPAQFQARRRQRLIDLGIIPEETRLSPALNFPAFLDSHKAPWDERPPAERAIDARRMEIYAASVELLDQQVGRLLAHLKATGRMDHTYVIFLSDNGASMGSPLMYPNNTRAWLHQNHDLSLAQMGRPGSFTTLGRDWANNSNTPFRLFKQTVGDGGVRSPFLIAGPEIPAGKIQDAPSHVTSVVPTLLELAAIDPAEQGIYAGKLRPRAASLLATLTGVHPDAEMPIVTELYGSYMVRKGRWKAANITAPVGKGEWELYDVVADPSETFNVADERPDIVDELASIYAAYARENEVVLADPPQSVRPEAFYEGACDWLCEAKFALAGWLIN
ncbi:MAG: arylsulfatase [Pseudomonadota bacterium]